MIIPESIPVPSDPALVFPDLNTEIKKLPPLENAEAMAKHASESNQQFAKGSERRNTGDMDHKLSQLLQHSVGRDSELSITVDKATRKVVVKVLDSQTKELIRQIPPEELLHLFEGLKELSGALVDEVI